MTSPIADALRPLARPIDSLRALPGNPRRGDVAAVARSYEAFGQRKPIVALPDGTVIAGNHQLEAARLLGWTEIAVVVVDDDEATARAFSLADNRTSDLGAYDLELLEQALAEVRLDPELLAAAGYSPDISLLGRPGLGGGLDGLGPPILPGAPPAPPAPAPAEPRPSLADRFVLPPFSVLDQRSGAWQQRRSRWLSLGIRSEVGRGLMQPDSAAFPGNRAKAGVRSTIGDRDAPTNRDLLGLAAGEPWSTGLPGMPLSGMVPDYYEQKNRAEALLGRALSLAEFEAEHLQVGDAASVSTIGTSVFDPVLCELVYRWWSPPGALVLDPFAGGSVRGLLAGLLGRRYLGIDLRPEQVAANEEQAREIAPEVAPRWIAADSREAIPALPESEQADLVFSCPPYADLERYSDDPRDLSTMAYDDFLAAYREIIAASAARLRPNRFAAFVVGDVRSPRGVYRGFIRDTIDAFRACGLELYNEAIIVSPVGSLPVRVSGQFDSGRKLGKTHQNLLVFVKGDWRAAVAACGPVEVSLPDWWGEEATPGAEPGPTP